MRLMKAARLEILARARERSRASSRTSFALNSLPAISTSGRRKKT